MTSDPFLDLLEQLDEEDEAFRSARYRGPWAKVAGQIPAGKPWSPPARAWVDLGWRGAWATDGHVLVRRGGPHLLRPPRIVQRKWRSPSDHPELDEQIRKLLHRLATTPARDEEVTDVPFPSWTAPLLLGDTRVRLVVDPGGQFVAVVYSADGKELRGAVMPFSTRWQDDILVSQPRR